MNPTVPQPPRPQNYYGAAIHQYLGDPIVTIDCWCGWHTVGDKTTALEALKLHNQTSHPTDQPTYTYTATTPGDHQ